MRIKAEPTTTQDRAVYSMGVESIHAEAHTFPTGRELLAVNSHRAEKRVEALFVEPNGREAFVYVASEVAEGNKRVALRDFLSIEQARDLRDQLNAALEDEHETRRLEGECEHCAAQEDDQNPDLEPDWADEVVRAGYDHPFPEVR